MTKCNLCKGVGWLITFVVISYRIEKCDECCRYGTDEIAGNAFLRHYKRLKGRTRVI